MIGAVIPTRGDRKDFLDNCFKMLDKQSLLIDKIYLANDPPLSDEKDITLRYRKGFENLFSQGCEVVFLIEDDDFYHKDYIKIMFSKWLELNKPEILGVDSTTYYHLKKREFRIMNHKNRSSAFSTLVTKQVLNINWPEDSYPFLDLELWKQLKGVTFDPGKKICLGIKHNIGLSGGSAHNESFKYDIKDPDLDYLKTVVGKDFDFYKKMINDL